MSATLVDADETVSRQCFGRGRYVEGTDRNETDCSLSHVERLSVERTTPGMGSKFGAGCSNRLSNKAAADESTGGVAAGWVEDFVEPRTQVEGCFNSDPAKRSK